MQIFDIHTHIYPDDIAQKATDSVRKFYELDGAPGMSGTASKLLEQGKKAGISGFLILPVAIRPDRAEGINDFLLAQVSQHKEFYGFGTVHAAMQAPEAEAERIIAMGLRGIKMHPDSQKFNIDDPRLFPMYEAIQGRIPVMLHVGDPRYDYSHPARLRRVLSEFPKLQAIAAHFGGYTMHREALELLGDTDCIMDISSSMMFMEPGEAEKYINIYGAERMAYGTDYPLWDPVDEVQRFLQLKLTPDQLEQIAWKTAYRFLGL